MGLRCTGLLTSASLVGYAVTVVEARRFGLTPARITGVAFTLDGRD